MRKKVIKNKKDRYIAACQNCTLPVNQCKGTCTRKEMLQNAANADTNTTEAKNGKQQNV